MRLEVFGGSYEIKTLHYLNQYLAIHLKQRGSKQRIGRKKKDRLAHRYCLSLIETHDLSCKKKWKYK